MRLAMHPHGVLLAMLVEKLLADRGFTVSRHSTSMMVFKDKLIATIHINGDTCTLRVYKPYAHLNSRLVELIEGVLRGVCGYIALDESRTVF